MRGGLVLFAWTRYLPTVRNAGLDNLTFYISAAFILFSSLLVIGGFLRTSVLTRVSAVSLLLLGIYRAVILFSHGWSADLSVYIMLAAIALFFTTKGNR